MLFLFSLVSVAQETELSNYEKYKLAQESERFDITPDTIYKTDTVYIESQTKQKDVVINNYYIEDDFPNYRYALTFGYRSYYRSYYDPFYYEYRYYPSHYYSYWGYNSYYFKYHHPYNHYTYYSRPRGHTTSVNKTSASTRVHPTRSSYTPSYNTPRTSTRPVYNTPTRVVQPTINRNTSTPNRVSSSNTTPNRPTSYSRPTSSTSGRTYSNGTVNRSSGGRK